MEAAEWEGEFGVEIERGGGETAFGDRELCVERKLETELSFSRSAFCDDFGYRVARDSAAERSVQDWAAGGAFLGGGEDFQEVLWP